MPGRNVDEFLLGLPDDVRADMQELDAEIAGVMSGLERTLYVGKFWGGSDQEIIGYGIYRYTPARGPETEWFMVGLALQKQYISIYVNAVEGDRYVAEKYGADLGNVKVGKAAISFKRLDDIDLRKLVEVLRRPP